MRVDNLADQAQEETAKAASLCLTEHGQEKIESIKRLIYRNTNKKKIRHLQKLIDSKQYKVDAVSIADRLVDSHIEIFE